MFVLQPLRNPLGHFRFGLLEVRVDACHNVVKSREEFVVKVQPLAIGMRKNDENLAKWINAWVEKNTSSGQLNQIYTKWMGLSLPDMKKVAEEARAIAQ